MTLSENTQKLQKFIASTPNPQDIPAQDLKIWYQLFIDTLVDHNHLYYIEAKPIISDLEYDELFAYLKAIEEYYPAMISSTSPTQGLIGQLSDGFKKAEHKVPLLSLENSYNAEDIRDRAQRVAKIAEKQGKIEREYLLEAKFDGLSVEFIYENGVLTQAITRGDGKIGEDITANVKMIPSLPKKIGSLEKLHFRGEVMMPKTQLKKLNQEREKKGQNIFANTRNAAAGSLKLLDSGEVAKRGLIVFIYDQLVGAPQDIEALGLPTFKLPQSYRSTNDIEKLISRCQSSQVKNFLEEQDFDCDGLVIKVLDTENIQMNQKSDASLFDTEITENKKESIREILGATEHHPRRAIAYKFPAQQVATQIHSVDFQIGRTGIITPVANIEPVKLSGALISRVSLHNFDFIKNKQIKNKDFVRVQRSGEVIPYIVSAIKDRRNGEEEPIIPPLFCPVCGSPINNIDIHYYCSNPKCPAQLKEKIAHFVSRDAMDIGGIGEVMIEVLVEQKILTSVADLYQLTNIQNQILLRKFPNFGEKKISELVNQLEASKKNPLWRILNALGIPNVGKKIAQDLADYLASKNVHSLQEMLNALKNEELSALFGIGEKIKDGIQIFITSSDSLALLYHLEEAGISFDTTKEEKKEIGSIKGHFSLTGTFPLSRGELIKQIEQQGYLYQENPNKETDIMFIGEKPGTKAEKAKKIGIMCLENWSDIVEKFGLSDRAEKDDRNGKQVIQGGLF